MDCGLVDLLFDLVFAGFLTFEVRVRGLALGEVAFETAFFLAVAFLVELFGVALLEVVLFEARRGRRPSIDLFLSIRYNYSICV